ncbi:MAG: DUF6521 family protein [Cytophagaceae bacterium]|jgi:hypothetical protein|nr:DUF6521 family protein [Cytophagaceae bacterium]
MKVKSAFHNEVLGALTLNFVLAHQEAIDYSKSLLVLPFLFHARTVNLINSSKSFRLEKLLNDKELIGGFNERYYSFLPISINTIFVANSLSFISITNDNITLKNTIIYSPDMGDRALKIYNAAPMVSSILQSFSSSYLYTKLKINL